jgi:hypothetical protein
MIRLSAARVMTEDSSFIKYLEPGDPSQVIAGVCQSGATRVVKRPSLPGVTVDSGGSIPEDSVRAIAGSLASLAIYLKRGEANE